MIRLTRAEAASLGLVEKLPARSQANKDDDGMNKTERRFSEILTRMLATGVIKQWDFEPERFRLADKTFLKIDFRVTLSNFQTIFVEVKALDKQGRVRWEDDAAAKVKTVAEHHPYAFFLAAYGEGRWKIRRLHSRRWCGIKADIEWAV
jgi:hypothetical protein